MDEARAGQLVKEADSCLRYGQSLNGLIYGALSEIPGMRKAVGRSYANLVRARKWLREMAKMSFLFPPRLPDPKWAKRYTVCYGPEAVVDSLTRSLRKALFLCREFVEMVGPVASNPEFDRAYTSFERLVKRVIRRTWDRVLPVWLVQRRRLQKVLEEVCEKRTVSELPASAVPVYRRFRPAL